MGGIQMTDDIVTRLRAEGEMEAVGDGTEEWQFNEICQEAADEIERLRKQVESFAGLIRSLSRNVLFVEYENEREQRVKDRAKDND
jgi:hypothetical protein